MTAVAARLQVERRGFVLDVDIVLPAHGISVLFGASGSGKTTLLRAIAGLEPDARGRVAVGDTLWQDDAAGERVPVWQRRVGYVFQESSLFEHLDVAGNIAYGLRWHRPRDAETPATRATRLDALVELLGIGELLQRRVETLSGGERQRVAIARAMAIDPAVLLLDEPLAALDFERRHEIMGWLERLRDTTGTPMLYVSHALDELARLGDRVLVLADGRIAACGEPEPALRAAGLNAAADRLPPLRCR